MKKIFDDIYVGSNIISKLNDYTKDFDKILIFSNETIADLYFEKFKSTLNEKDKIFYFAIKDGEEYKNIESILPVYDFMLEKPGSPKKGIPVPLFNLVYHDCVIEPWMMDKVSNDEDYMLYALINNSPVSESSLLSPIVVARNSLLNDSLEKYLNSTFPSGNMLSNSSKTLRIDSSVAGCTFGAAKMISYSLSGK